MSWVDLQKDVRQAKLPRKHRPDPTQILAGAEAQVTMGVAVSLHERTGVLWPLTERLAAEAREIGDPYWALAQRLGR